VRGGDTMAINRIGDSGAVAPPDVDALYRQNWDLVVSYLRGQGARDPEDLASEAFVGVLRNLHRFEGDDAAFRSWLLVIAHRRLVDQRRAQARRPTELVEPLRLVQLGEHRAARSTVRSTEDQALARLSARRLVRALAALTDDQRTVVLMHSVDDLSLPEIATALGKRLAAVKSLHHRGRAAAQRALAGAPHPHPEVRLG
jgi:RNA polymerase sigma factor (sigma-70 family)